MNYSEFFRQAAIACLAPLSVADKCHPKHGAALAAEYAEALADELVKRGHLQPPVKRVALDVEAEAEPLRTVHEITRKIQENVILLESRVTPDRRIEVARATTLEELEKLEQSRGYMKGWAQVVWGIRNRDATSQPEPTPGTTCASCLHFQPGDVCSKHEIQTTYDSTCKDYQ